MVWRGGEFESVLLTNLFLRAWWLDWSGSWGCPDEPVHWAVQCLKNRRWDYACGHRQLTHRWWMGTEEILRILRSSLPGRSRAGSRVSGLLVAMIILTLCSVSKPSIWFSSWQNTLHQSVSAFNHLSTVLYKLHLGLNLRKVKHLINIIQWPRFAVIKWILLNKSLITTCHPSKVP